MQAGPKPEPVVKKRSTVTVTGVPQETFAEPAKALAAKLGWKGEPDWVGNDITVRDAERFIQKSLHEAHIAGALGQSGPSAASVCEHLGVTDSGDQSAVGAALALAHESGKSQPTSEIKTKNVSIDAKASGSGSAMLGRMSGAK